MDRFRYDKNVYNTKNYRRLGEKSIEREKVFPKNIDVVTEVFLARISVSPVNVWDLSPNKDHTEIQ